MITGIDHAVIVVRDLESAINHFWALGFTVTPGGTHADGQTHNALIAFTDGSYIELIAFIQPEQPSMHYWWPRLAEGEGLEDFCLASNDLAADADRWRAEGLMAQGPNDGGRVRPDGEQLRWHTVRFDQPTGDATLPFVIEDVTPRDLRVASGEATNHALTSPNPVSTRLAGITIATNNLEDAIGRYVRLLGANPIGHHQHSAQFVVGNHWLTLQAPRRDDDEVALQLQSHGAGPISLTLAQAGLTSPIVLDLTIAHGVTISVQG